MQLFPQSPRESSSPLRHLPLLGILTGQYAMVTLTSTYKYGTWEKQLLGRKALCCSFPGVPHFSLIVVTSLHCTALCGIFSVTVSGPSGM